MRRVESGYGERKPLSRARLRSSPQS